MAAEGHKQVLARPIHFAEQVSKLAMEVKGSRPNCLELKSKADKLSALHQQAARVDFYDRPTRRIMDNAMQVLEKVLALLSKYRFQHSKAVRRVFTPVPAAAFKKTSSLLNYSVSDVSWLLRVSTTFNKDDSRVCPVFSKVLREGDMKGSSSGRFRRGGIRRLVSDFEGDVHPKSCC